MKKDFLKVFVFIAILWAIHALQIVCAFNPAEIVVSQKNGVFSIFTGVFIHLNFFHLASNSSVLLVTLPLLLRFYKKDAFNLILLGLFIPSTFVYILDLNVLGISGLVYAIMWFIIFSGIAAKDSFKFFLSIGLALFYSKTLIGITPMAGHGISWQAHLGGFAVAVVLSLRNILKLKTN